MKNKKIVKSYVDHGFGFPICIENAPFKKIRGEWVLDVNFKRYEKLALMALATKKSRLTGNEIKFVRHCLEMNLKDFGSRFGDVAHSAVVKWEKCEDEPTKMNWPTEKDIRMAVIEHVKPKFLYEFYREFQYVVPSKKQKIEIDLKMAA